MKYSRYFVWSLLSLIAGLGASGYCPQEDDESVLQKNHIYTYSYKSTAVAQAVGTTEDQGNMDLECKVTISHDRSCFYHLQLQDCQITATGGGPGAETAWLQQPLPDLSKYHSSFSLVKGEIKNVLVHPDEPLHYRNIKRGILSAFIFKLSQLKNELEEMRTDIHGRCPLKSVPESETEARTTKDMLNCEFPSRPDWQFSPLSIFWNMSFIRHVINSSADCYYRITENRVDSVHCKERHAIMLESSHNTTTAVQTNVLYHVDFVNSEPQNSKSVLSHEDNYRKTGIVYEYEDTLEPASNPPDFIPKASKMLSDLVLDSLDEIRLFTIQQFTDFIAWLRTSSDLTAFVDKVRSCDFLPDGADCDDMKKELAFSYLSDALLQCNSLPCAKAVTYLANNDDISPTYLDFIYRSWSYMYYSKPGFVTNFAELCKRKESQQCWLSIGTFARRVLSRSEDLNEKVMEEVRMLANHFHSRIEEDCEATVGADNSHYTDCLIFLKAASNMGQYYSGLAPEGIDRLLEHASNDHSPTFVRTSALEAIKDTHDLAKQEIYDEILPLLRNASLPPSIRILAYDVLLLVFEDRHFDEALLDILKTPKDYEVKHYVADSLNSLYSSQDFRSKKQKFLNSLTELLRENRLSLEMILYESREQTRSRTVSNSILMNFPFLPDSMKRFGLKALETNLFDSYIYPTVLNQESIMELFSTFVPASKLGSYFEGWEELLLAYHKNLEDMNLKPQTVSNIYDAVMKTLQEYGSEEGNESPTFDDSILQSIEKIHRLYWQHHKKLNPYAKAYLDLFGSTIKYMIQDSFKQSLVDKDFFKLMRYLLNDFEDGLSFNTTKVIRVIEAYHQVPTMMGLPLNWTANATLAFSVRAGLKYKHDLIGNQIHSKGFLQPSIALTFLNRMVVDFPTLTQIGVQANSSGYSSTDLKMQYNSAKGKHSFRLERPTRTQKVLELFRMNQLIKHDRYEDIPDWDIERTSTSRCTKNSITALNFCLSKSYPNVTHRLKPWAVMAGTCRWQFIVKPIDQDRVHYDVHLQETEKRNSKEYTAKFSVTEKEKEKALTFKLVSDENRKDMKLELRIPLIPDFLATLSNTELTQNRRISGQKIDGLLQLHKDFKYDLEYSSVGILQAPLPPSNDTVPDEGSFTRFSEVLFSLRTPFDVYKFNKTEHKDGGNKKVEALIEYESLNAYSNWMRQILSPSLWVNDRKASVKALFHWKQPGLASDDHAPDATTRQTEIRITLPRQTITVLGDSLQMENREQVKVNLAKRNHEVEELESFLNFTYDMWKSEDEESASKEVRQINITIPRRSWAGDYHRTSHGMKNKHEVRLRRILMKARDDQERDYVGWWTEEASKHFSLQEHEIKLVADIEMLGMSQDELIGRYPHTLKEEDVRDLSSSGVEANIALYYPFSNKVERIVFDGYFIMSRGMKVYRFQKNFDITSSYNNLRLTCNSVYRTDTESTTLFHHAFFTYLPSETKAYHTIHYKSITPTGKCRQVTFNHDIQSPVLGLSTTVSYKCDPENDSLYTLLLKLNTNSSKWNMLEMNIDQIIQDVSPDYRREDMTLNHPLGTIHTDAEWHGEHKDLQKRFVVCSKNGNCPNAELQIESLHDGKASWKLSLPNQNDTQITYDRHISSDYKTLNVKMGHSDDMSNFTEFLDFTGEIIAERFQVWKGLVDVNSSNKVISLLQSAYCMARNAVVTAAKDDEHPLNEILRPTLKMSLYDYCDSVNSQVKEFFSLRWIEIKEAFSTLEAFTDPAYAVLCNTFTSVRNVFQSAYYSVKEKSVIIWAVNYFEIPSYLKQGFLHIPSGLTEFAKQFALQENATLHFKLFSGKFLSWSSFREWPSLSFYPSWLSSMFPNRPYNVEPIKAPKTALVFGPQHVYTFDGHLYDIPSYPQKDCVLLLAHDVHRSLFTVLSSEKGIHILFPEMSITIDDRNEVFINASSKPTSLPIQSSNGKVTVKRGLTTEIWSPSLTVVCSDRHFLCILKLREFHEGGIIGLLGNADNYLDNEFMLPDGNVTTDLLEHVKSYEVSGKPECGNFPLNPAKVSSEEAVMTCQQQFFSLCRRLPAEREKFLQACISDVSAGLGSCYAAAGLSALCHSQCIPTHTSCNAERQGNPNIGRNLEVMLVVQESKYLTSPGQSSAPLKGIESLLTAIDVQFKEKGYDRILYSVVAYGGSGVHYSPGVHSSTKDLWTPLEETVNDVLKTLEFKSTDDADGVRALKYALDELGYDTFSSKIAIIITAKDRQVAGKSLTDAIQQLLEENGITLYTISSYPSIEKGKKVYGVRADGLIFPSQTQDGDAYLDYPRGNLAKLTSATRGSVFLSKFLSENNPPSYFSEFAQEVWAKVNKESHKCRQCRDVEAVWWWHRQMCSIVDC